MGEADTERLRTGIGGALATYGVEVVRVVLTHVMPPMEFVASRESRRLAAVQRAEEEERHELAVVRQSRPRRSSSGSGSRPARGDRARGSERGREARAPREADPRVPATRCAGTSRASASTSPDRSPRTPGRWSRSGLARDVAGVAPHAHPAGERHAAASRPEAHRTRQAPSGGAPEPEVTPSGSGRRPVTRSPADRVGSRRPASGATEPAGGAGRRRDLLRTRQRPEPASFPAAGGTRMKRTIAAISAPMPIRPRMIPSRLRPPSSSVSPSGETGTVMPATGLPS